MPIATSTASPWPGRCAYISATIFIAASGATNIVYGWSKGDSLPTSLVWAGVAGAVAIVFALAWPAAIRSFDQKRWSAALITLVALTLSGAYSVTAALGSATGGRANAAAAETATNSARAKAQFAYDAARRDLDALANAKPADELRHLLETTQAELARLQPSRPLVELEALDRRHPGRDCGMENGTGRWLCQRPGPYAVELARARQKERLQAKVGALVEDAGKAEDRLQAQRAAARAAVEQASAELAKIQPPKLANSDAVALATYQQAIGFDFDADRANRLLALLTVLIMECGGGLSLAIGMALSGPSGRAGKDPADKARTLRTTPADVPNTPANGASGQTGRQRPAEPLRPSTLRAPASGLIEWLRLHGGRAETSMRRLASAIGRSPSGVHEELRRLVASGAISAVSGPRGTLLALVEGAG